MWDVSSLRALFIIGMMGLSFDYSENKLRARFIHVLLLFILWEINFTERRP